MLKGAMCFTLYIKMNFTGKRAGKTTIFKAPDKLDIVYEDENIILIDKKRYCYRTSGQGYHLIRVARVQHYLYNNGEYNPKEEKRSLHLANKLTRNTGGILIAARSCESLRVLNAKNQNKKNEKYYLCLLHDKPKKIAIFFTIILLKTKRKNKVKVFQ